MNPKITEAEIVDVLVGGASNELAERVKAAIAEDPKLAALYDEWSSFIPTVRKQTVDVRRMADSAGRRVHDRLPTEFRALYNPAEPWSESQLEIFKRFHRPRAAWGKIWIQAAAAAAAAAIVAFLSVYFLIWNSSQKFFPQQSRRGDMTDVAIEQAVGAFSVAPADDEKAIVISSDADSVVILPNQSQITIQQGAEVHVRSNEVWQKSGVVQYRSPKNTIIHLPQGTVQSLEHQNAYVIRIIPGNAPVLEVLEGQVRLLKKDQSELSLAAGQSITFE